MKALKEQLAVAITDASFDLEYTEVRGDGKRIAKERRDLASDELAVIYTSRRGRIGRMRAFCHVSDESMRSVEAEVRNEFAEFICPQSDRLGHLFPIEQNGLIRASGGENGVFHLEFESTPENFAKSLLQAAAIIGVEKVTELLAAWKAGTPTQFKKMTVLNGVVLDAQYAPRQDIEIVALPLTTDELTRLPDRERIVPYDYLGRTLVSLRASACPVLFRPQQNGGSGTATTCTQGDIGIDDLCDVLSLQANSHVAWTFIWTEHDDAASFCLHDSTISGNGQFDHLMWRSHVWLEKGRKPGAVSIERGEYVSVTTLDEAKLIAMIEAIQNSDDKLRIAINRWKQSLRPNISLADQLIELRIAMEALYLKDFTNERSQEMRFRLALFGAWHLGETFASRKSIRKTLRDAYDHASGAVHAGEAPASARTVLKAARNLCRDGILKLLEGRSPDDWGDLILGQNLKDEEP